MKKTIGASVAVLGTAGVLSALALFGGPGATNALPVDAGTTPVALVQKTLSQSSSETALAYLQKGNTVAVHKQKGGSLVARLTLKSASFDKAKGEVLLSVTAKKDFSFLAKQFIWEDEEGADGAPISGDRVVRVAAGTTKSVRIDFRNVGEGAIVWATGMDGVAGTWTVANR